MYVYVTGFTYLELSLLAVKFHPHSFFFLRDMDYNIRPGKTSHAWDTN